MIKKILLSIIPIRYWIALLIAVLLFITKVDYYQLAIIICNLLLIIISVKLAIVLHEIGHLLFAKLVGGRPRRIVLGKKHKIIQTTIAGVKVVLHSDFNSGLAYAAFDNLTSIRLKLFLFYSGGFLTNFCIAGITYLLFDFQMNISNAINIVYAVFLSNLITGVVSLIPYTSTYNGIKQASDGRLIFNIPSYKKEDLLTLSNTNQLLDAYDLMELQKYGEAIPIYEEYRDKVRDAQHININIAIAYLKLGNYEKSLLFLETLIPIRDDATSFYKSTIYNGLAWNYLLLNRIDDADKYSDIAYKSNYKDKNIKGTRAAVLITKGQFEKGKDLIIGDVDFSFPNNQTLAAAMYLEFAFLKLEKPKKAKKYSAFLEKNIQLLDVDEKTLYDRLKNNITS